MQYAVNALLRRAGFAQTAEQLHGKRLKFSPGSLIGELTATISSVVPLHHGVNGLRINFLWEVNHHGRNIVGLQYTPDDPDQPWHALYKEPTRVIVESVACGGPL